MLPLSRVFNIIVLSTKKEKWINEKKEHEIEKQQRRIEEKECISCPTSKIEEKKINLCSSIFFYCPT